MYRRACVCTRVCIMSMLKYCINACSVSQMAESERNSLLPSALQSAVPQRHQQYSSFDNQGLWLEEEGSNHRRSK